MLFAYSARDPMGRRVEGELEGKSAEDVTRNLEGRALTVRWVRMVLPAGPSSFTSRSSADAVRTAASPEPGEPSPAEAPIEEGGDGEADAAGSADQRSGCSPWSLIIFLLLLSQILRAC